MTMTTTHTFLVICCGVSALCSSVADGAFVSRPTLSCWTTTRSVDHRARAGSVSLPASLTPWNEHDNDYNNKYDDDTAPSADHRARAGTVSLPASSTPWNEHDDNDDYNNQYDDDTAPTVYTGTDMPSSSSSSSSSSSKWSPVDDWNRLSSEINRGPDGATILNQDLAQQAARAMEQGMTAMNDPQDLPSQESAAEHAWLKDKLDDILTFSGEPNDDDDDEDQEAGYNTLTPTEKLDGLDTEQFVDDMGREIALLVRCNTSPQDMLIQEGRALPPLTEEQRNDVTQLVTIVRSGKANNGWQMTDFFREAVMTMFDAHAVAVDDDNNNVMDAAGVATWMKKSLGAEEPGPIGRHNQRVCLTMSTFSKYGSGYLDRDDFMKLYLSAIVGESTPEWRQLKYRAFEITSVWRDLRNHGTVSPVETMRAELVEQMESKYKSDPLTLIANFMDESYFLEDSIVDDLLGRDKRTRSSYEGVELASDNKTPLWMRDGEFVFIDEDSCIGCTQCVSAAPSSFKMNDDGRASTFAQRSSPDVASAVEVCPVDCMHHVSFNELKELETVRDHGDGRTDHRHLGKNNTPLHVSGITSDANHRSSWYHYLKNKCDCSKGACFDCPSASEKGGNPRFKEHLKRAEHIRANHFMENGMADNYRKTADL